MGPVAARLRELYSQVVRSQLPRYRHWNVPVYAAPTSIGTEAQAVVVTK